MSERLPAEYVAVGLDQEEWYPYWRVTNSPEDGNWDGLLTQEELSFVKRVDADCLRAQKILETAAQRARTGGEAS